MKKGRSVISIVLIVGFLLSMAACNKGSSKETNVPSTTKQSIAVSTVSTEPKVEEFKLSGPVSMIVPYSTGGGTDTVGRLVAQYLTNQLGQQINVINKPGASGTVGITELSHQKPTGYNIALCSISDLYVADYRKTFDLNSVDYVIQLVQNPFALFASPKSPYKNIKDLIDDVKRGNKNVAIAQSGTAQLIAIGLFCEKAGIDMLKDVSFSSGGESQTALLGNHVDLACLTPAYIANVEAGGGKLLGIYGTEKNTLYEGKPFLLESGYAIPNAVGTNLIITLPKGCPENVRSFWKKAVENLLQNQDFQQAMAKAGYVLVNLSGDSLAQSIKTNNSLVAATMKQLGL